MSDIPPKYRDMILEAIETLRVRKTRPDGPRIVHYCSKNYGLSSTEVKLELERLVDDDAVLKVEYKGSVSFRDAEKWIPTDSTQGMLQYKGSPDDLSDLPQSVQFGHVQNSTITTERIIAAVQSLSDTPTAGTSRSKTAAAAAQVTVDMIEKHISHLYPGTKLQGDHLKKCIIREVDCGRLVQLVNDSFVLAERVTPNMRIQRQAAVIPPMPTGRKKLDKKKKKRVKLPGKKAEYFDYEVEPDYWKPKKIIKKAKLTTARSSGLGAIKLDLAMRKKSGRYCLECIDQRGMQGARMGILLECTSCNYATHPGCGGYSAETVAAIGGSYKCMQCKRCKICNTGILGQDATLVVCVQCDSSFHMACHNPPVSVEQAAKVEFRCADCKLAALARKTNTARKQHRSTGIKSKTIFTPLTRLSDDPPLVTSKTAGFSTNNGNVNGSLPKKLDKNSFGGLTKSEVIIRAVENFCDSMPPKKTPELVREIAAWTVDEVAQKFEQRSLPDFAASVRAQGIDGAALMLLTRDDVITRFNLSLVPALKLYRGICDLCPFGPFTDWS